MHGRLKVKTSHELEEQKRKERLEKALVFKSGSQKAFEKRERQEYDEESLAICGQLLSYNPDFYTLWNFRRETLLFIKNKLIEENNCETNNEVKDDLEAFQRLCERELELTANCLKVNPKSYCAWHQRSWIIERMPKPNLQLEISLCSQLLQMDERNFHCWNYRRFVSKLAKISVKQELEFTLEKIKQNFSNFSSWYYRSCLFTFAANYENFDFAKEWKKEYELVENALFTDPSDQSAWFYHKWLISTNYGNNMKHSIELNHENIVTINRVVYNSSQSLLIVNFSRPLKHRPLVMVKINDHFLAEIEWNSNSNNTISDIWYSNIQPFLTNKLTQICFNPIPTFAINPECIEPIDIKNDQNNDQLFVWETSGGSDQQLVLEERYLESLRSLYELEPNNKWINLSLAWIDHKKRQNNDIFERLIKLDPLRTNYYNDLKSKMVLKNSIESSQSSSRLILKSLSITALYYTNRLTHIQFLDLSHNLINKLSKNLNHLVSLEVLIMDFNNINTIDRELKLINLKVLSLNNNKIKKIDCLANLQNCTQMKQLMITENPISTTLESIPVSQLLLSDKLLIISSNTSNNINDS